MGVLTMKVKKTLLSTQHRIVCSTAVAFFALLLAFAHQKVITEKTICQSPMFSDRVLNFQKILFGAISGVCYLYFCKYIRGSFRLEGGDSFHSAHRMNLFICFLSATSGFLQFIDYFETTCEDQYGVQSPVLQWIEWQISVPLMFYLNIILDDRKDSISLNDAFVIFCAWASISSCWALNFSFAPEISVLFISSSTVFMGVSLTLNVYLARETYVSVKSLVDGTEKKCALELAYLNNVRRKYNASIFLLEFFPVFAIIYFAGLLMYIDKETVLILFLFFNFAAKLMFSLYVMDAHHDILDPSSYALLVEEKANASRRAFLRYVLHEVRVPLNSISMGLNLLEDEGNGNGSGETILMIKEAVSFMTDTLNDVLSIQKIEEGKLELEYEEFYTKDVLKTVRHSLWGQMVAKSLRLVEKMDDDIPVKVRGDRFRIEHVIANFVSNAVKFSPEGGCITITVKVVQGSGDEVAQHGHQIIEFTVRDEGTGISKEDQKKLFTHYSQINPGAMQAGKGTGVGLAICRETVLLHGGRIGVRSNEITATEKGYSEFFFSIEFEVVQGADNGKSKAGKNSRAGNDSIKETSYVNKSPPLDNGQILCLGEREQAVSLKDFGTWNVLVTDDVDSNRKLLVMLLKRKGITSHQANDGLLCLEYVDKNPNYFDVIFMDNMMPNMIGTEAIATLRQRNYEGIIIGLTGDAMDEDVENFMSSGADIVMVKPLSVPQLNLILSHLSEHGFDHTANMEGYKKNGNKTKLQLSCQSKKASK